MYVVLRLTSRSSSRLGYGILLSYYCCRPGMRLHHLHLVSYQYYTYDQAVTAVKCFKLPTAGRMMSHCERFHSRGGVPLLLLSCRVRGAQVLWCLLVPVDGTLGYSYLQQYMYIAAARTCMKPPINGTYIHVAANMPQRVLYFKYYEGATQGQAIMASSRFSSPCFRTRRQGLRV